MKLIKNRTQIHIISRARLSLFMVMMLFPFQLISMAQETEIAAPEITLTQAINTALANNTQMKQALLTVKDADQQIRSAWSSVMPTVAASASYTRNLEIPVNFIPAIIFDPNANPGDLVPVAFGTDNNWQGGFSANQTIFSGQAFVGISAAELYKTAQDEALRATSQGIVTQTRISYYQVLIAKEQFDLVHAQVERVKKNLKDTKALFEQGFTDEYSVLQLEVQLANLEPQLTSAEFGISNAKRELLDVIGLPLDLPFQAVGDLSSYDIYSETAVSNENAALKEVDLRIPLDAEADSLVLEQAFLQRGDLRILDVQKKLQQKNLTAQRSAYLPTISANYNLGWTASQPGTPDFFGTEDNRARSQVLGVSVQLPIFQGFRRDAAIQQTKIQIKNLEIQATQTQRTATKEVLSAQEAIREVFQTTKARSKAVEQAQKGYERAIARQKAGVGSQQEVTDADLQLRQAEINYSQTVFSYLISKAQYDQAVGKVPFVDDIQAIKEKIEL